MKKLLPFILVGVMTVISCNPEAITAPTTTNPPVNVELVEVPEEPRPFADDTAWNTPVSELEEHPDAEERVADFWETHRRDPRMAGQINMSLEAPFNFSAPIYYADENTPRKRAYPEFQTWLDSGYGIEIGEKIPWDPKWKPAPGTDGDAIIIDTSFDPPIEYDVSRINVAAQGCAIWRIQAEINPIPYQDWDLCVGDASIASLDIVNGDALHSRSMGMGNANLAGVLRLSDAVNGLDHALALTIYGTMFGPDCAKEGIEPYQDEYGVTCGFTEYPATKLEWPATKPSNLVPRCSPDSIMEFSDEQRAKTTPEGTRFSIEMSDVEIENWLDLKEFKGQKRDVVKNIVVGLVKYGWIIAKTSCDGALFDTTGISEAKGWEAIGMQRDDLWGLFTPDNLRVYKNNQP